MTDKELKNILNTYTVKIPEDGITNTKKAVSNTINAPVEPRFNAINFLSGQIRNLRASFAITALLYLSVVLCGCLLSESNYTVLIIGTATPFLSVSAMTVVFSGYKKESMELEMTCLYQPKTIFAGRSVLCGIMNLISVSIGSVICALLNGMSVNTVLLSGLACLVLSSVITLGSFTLLKTRTALIFSTGVFCALGGSLLSKTNISRTLSYITPMRLLIAIIAGGVLLSVFYIISVKKYNFERMCKNVY